MARLIQSPWCCFPLVGRGEEVGTTPEGQSWNNIFALKQPPSKNSQWKRPSYFDREVFSLLSSPMVTIKFISFTVSLNWQPNTVHSYSTTHKIFWTIHIKTNERHLISYKTKLFREFVNICRNIQKWLSHQPKSTLCEFEELRVLSPLQHLLHAKVWFAPSASNNKNV